MTDYSVLIQSARGAWLLGFYAVHVVPGLWRVESTLIRGAGVLVKTMSAHHGVCSCVDVTDRRWQFDGTAGMSSEIFHALQILGGKCSDKVHWVVTQRVPIRVEQG